MQIVTIINAKGGCGKSTIAMSTAVGLAKRGFKTLLIDMDPQAQITQWLELGDGFEVQNTLANVFLGRQSLAEVIASTHISNLDFVASCDYLEEIGQQLKNKHDYEASLARALIDHKDDYDFAIIDSPNQISPIMRNAIFPTDIFIVPFESTKAVRSYAQLYSLLKQLRPESDYRILHVLSNLTRTKATRSKVIQMLTEARLPIAGTEIRTCAYLSKIDVYGCSIFDIRPSSHGASDMTSLVDELSQVLQVNPIGV